MQPTPSSPLRITVLGTGTSVGVPAIGCDCPTCRSTRPENKRLRSSIYIEHQGGAILVDASTDFRQQALTYGIRRIDHLLMTHDHADHINGFDDLRSINFAQQAPIDVHARHDVLDTIRNRYAYCFNPVQLGGGVPQTRLHEAVPGRPLLLDGLAVLPIPLKHGVLDILGYRIGPRFAYLTDCSEVPDAALEMLRGVEVLVLDALRPEPHPTHFTLQEALACSRRIAARQTWFTHMTCRLEHFATNAALPPEARLLHDGQILEIPAGGELPIAMTEAQA